MTTQKQSKAHSKRKKQLINGSELDKILDRGREVTNRIAKEKVEEVFSKVGFGRY